MLHPDKSRFRPKGFLLAIATICALAAIIWFVIGTGQVEENIPSKDNVVNADDSNSRFEPESNFIKPADLLSVLEEDDSKAAIDEFWNYLNSSHGSVDEVSNYLMEFLNSGKDAPTGLSFQVGPGGNLSAAPSIRILALDWLGRIDPDAASAYSRVIFENSSSAGEWALALRNYGRALENPLEDAYLADRIIELLNNPKWSASPTAAYLEAFDAAVFSPTPAIIDSLLKLNYDSGEDAVRMASAMAMDNITRDNPELVASMLLDKDRSITIDPILKASLLSRLDPFDSRQTELLRTYLLDATTGLRELEVLAGIFPNHNGFISHFLLTQPEPGNLLLMAHSDLVALEIIQQWKKHPDFAHRLDLLTRMEVRLNKLVSSARRGGILENIN